jgi:RNA polymerase sigma-70 factor (ECF subfamily)
MRDLADHFSAQKRQPRMPIVPTQTTPGTMSMRREEVHRHLEAIERLPEDYRDVLKLRIVEDLPVEEIAEQMGRTRNAIAILICRARKALGERIDGKA